MTLSELKSLQKRIDRLRSKRAWLRSNAQNTTPSLSGMPSGNDDSDKLGTTVAQIADIDAEISALTAEYNAHIKRLSSDVFEEYAIIRCALKKVKRTLDKEIGNFDILIGATALHYGLTVVTDNVKHFEAMPDVKVVNWIERE